MKTFFFLAFLVCNAFHFTAQTDLVTYAGNNGKEVFYDVAQITDGTFLVCGYADDLDWIAQSVPRIELSYNENIPNGLGTNRYGFILHLSEDLQEIQQVVHFPQGAVEDIRFIKTNSKPYTPTGDLFISATTADTDDNNGGYIIGKLDGNFVEAIPTALSWLHVIWARSGPQEYHPWDVNANSEVYYVSGEFHGYDWSAVYSLDAAGERRVINNWRTHWTTAGSEWHGTPASSYSEGMEAVDYSGIVLKKWGRCDLRSWTVEDYNLTLPDGNGGTRQESGHWM